MMRRREFMKAFLAATVAPSVVAQTVVPPQTRTGPPAPGPVPWMQGLDHAQLETVVTLDPEDIAQSDTVFFSPAQMATLTRFCELLMPPIASRPGAGAAGVPSFLDFFVSESADEIKVFYRGGLDWLDAEAKQRFRTSFAATNATQADQIIRPLLRTWMTDHYPTEPHEKFVNAAHQDIRLATINSQAWAAVVAEDERASRRDMYWLPVEPDLKRTPAMVARASTKH
jgi:hypothetical protein